MTRISNIPIPCVFIIAVLVSGVAAAQRIHPSMLPSAIGAPAVDATTGSASHLPRVMLLVFEKNNEDVLKIVENLQLRMFDVDVKFGIRWIKPEITNHDIQVQTARKSLIDEHLQLVFFWNSGDRDTLYYLSPEQDAPLTRTIDDVGKESRPEAIALVVQTAVESLLSLDEPTPGDDANISKKTNEVNDTAETDELLHNSRNETVSNTAPKIIKHPPRPNVIQRHDDSKTSRPLRLFFQMGYELNLLNNSPTILQGGNMRLGLAPVSSFGIFAGVGATGYLESEKDGFSMKQIRIPVEIGGVGLFGKSPWRMGVGVSFLIVPLRNSPAMSPGIIENWGNDAGVGNSYWSKTFMVKIFTELRYYLSGNIALFVDIHLLVSPQMVSYQIVNGPTLFDEFNRLWPGFQAGIAFFTF